MKWDLPGLDPGISFADMKPHITVTPVTVRSPRVDNRYDNSVVEVVIRNGLQLSCATKKMREVLRKSIIYE